MGHTDQHAIQAIALRIESRKEAEQDKPFDANELARQIRQAPIRRDDELEVIVKAVATLASDYDAMPHNCKQWDLCELLDQAALLSEGTSV